MIKIKKLQKKKGFTLVELLVAVSILAIVTMALLPRLLPYSEAARTSAANKELRNLNTIVEAFAAVDGDYPEASLDLENPRSIASVMQDHGVKWTDDETGETDPWGNPYYYQSLGGGLYCIISAGPDGELGTDDDLYIDNFSNLSQGIPPIDMNEIIVPSSSNNPNPGGSNPGGGDGPGEEHQAEVPDGYIGIYTPEQLASIGNDPDYPLDGNYIVMNDLDLSGYENWTPIGNYGADLVTRFTGNFDGNYYVISNLTIDNNALRCQGLFGCVDVGSEIRNVYAENININGYSYVGGLVARNYSNITNCYVTGNITSYHSFAGGLVGYNYNNTITDCYTTASINGGTYAGGLIGRNDEGIIINCYSTSDVVGSSYIGGLVGYNYGTIENCYATGNVNGADRIGGLVGGSIGGTITNCHAVGAITGSFNRVGGLVGNSEQDIITKCYATCDVNGYDNTGGLIGMSDGESEITISYATGNVKGHTSIGGLLGNNNGTVTNCYATGNIEGKTGALYAGGLSGWNSGTITDCYSVGSTISAATAGGLIGRNTGVITNSYYDTNTSGRSDDGGRGTPLTTAEMKQQGNFADWDFIITWGVEENNSYPFLLDNEQIPHPNNI
jgi:prepilin-type N-terminal cleavage/methylation domain-containing protein